MFDTNGHVTDEDLLLLRDDELSRAKAYRVRRHLGSCRECQLRGADLERTISELGQVYDACTGQQIPADGELRARLRARIEEAASGIARERGAKRSVPGVTAQRWAYAIAALMILVLGGLAFYRQGRTAEFAPAATYVVDRPVPNVNLTPGATRTVTLRDICRREGDSEEDQDPAVPASVQRVLFEEYRIANAPTENYQVDYLISPQLGGTDDIRNLWPQPNGSTVWNSRAKDVLEARLHKMVCDREIDLESAQREIATNWISAYQKVFSTQDPL